MDITTLLVTINIVFTLLFVAAWGAFIAWKGVLNDVMKQLELAIESQDRILKRVFEEK